MKTNKVLIGGIAGGIGFFLLGWIIYGMLLMNVMQECNTGQAAGVMKEPMEMWAMVVSNLGLGFLFAVIFSRYATLPSVSTALQHGALLGVLMAITMDFSMYSMMNMMTLKGVFIDIAAYGVMCSLGAAMIAWVMGMGNKAETA